MPISTPVANDQPYYGDRNHFENVIKHLFIPAVEKIGFKAIPPTATGADVIQGEIIKQLDNADLVLCDISTLNPNVFFELGIRTALDKPVAYVKDEKTTKIPFDTGIINHHTYCIGPWSLMNQIDELAKHLKKSYDGACGKNPLWKYFGLNKAAEIKAEDSGLEAKMDLLLMRMENKESLQGQPKNRLIANEKDYIVLGRAIRTFLEGAGCGPYILDVAFSYIQGFTIYTQEKTPEKIVNEMEYLVKGAFPHETISVERVPF